MMSFRLFAAFAMLGLVFEQRETARFITGLVHDEFGKPVAGIRLTADGNLAVAPAVTDSDGSFSLSLVASVALGREVRIRAVDPDARFDPWVGTIVVAEQPRPVAIVLRSRGPVKPRGADLSLFIERMELKTRSGRALEKTTFPVPDVPTGSRQAAKWIRSMLAKMFPTTADAIDVSVQLNAAAESLPLRVTPEDALRDDRLWMFSGDSKIGHPDIVNAREAAREAVALAMTRGDPLVVHFDRPGYELGIVELRRSESRSITLARRQQPALTVVVDIAGNDLLSQRLRADLSGPDLEVLTLQDLPQRKEFYEQSLRPYLSVGQRLTLLRQARVDVFIGGVYDARSR